MITKSKLRSFFQSKVVVADQSEIETGAFVQGLDQY